MRRRIIVTFIFSVGILLLLTATAKLISSYGASKILNGVDPVFHVSFRFLFRAVAVVELGIGGVCLFSKNLNLRVGLIAAIATTFMLYRLGLYWMGFRGGCSCLGNLTDALHISPTLADRVMKIILGYLLIGSYGMLFWLWRQCGDEEGRMRHNAQLAAGSPTTGTSS